MKRLNILTILVACLPVVLTSCSNATSEQDGTIKNETKKEMVRIISLEEQEIPRSLQITSTLKAFNEVHLASAVPGKIEKILVEIGDYVNEGDTLVKMDDSQLIQARIQLNNLKTDFLRLDTLKKEGSIAEQQYDQLTAQYEVAMQNADYLARNTTLRASFDGVISGKYFENGEIYSGSPVASIGKAAIVSLIQINKLKTVVSISERYFPDIKEGMSAKVKVDVYPNMEFDGKITRIYPTINPQSRSFEAEISVDNRNDLLRPGMFSRITIELEQVNAFVLPAMAVLKMQGSNERYLFVSENGKAKRVAVEMGERYDDMVEVISNSLKSGDKIVINGQDRLLDGTEIQVVQ
ncbi:MAG: efflux RND transporter periplasmic adaptor subunit [Prolixibacteraceae bacterium]|nr:efflux RND transporter periplasmic adaptor subunit [Prolixibacteraceae bacterium]